MTDVPQSEEEFKDKLTSEQYNVLREKGTEPPFSGKYVDEKANGMYVCAACGAELFSSDTKYDSKSGWPSFSDVAKEGNVKLQEDTSNGMVRTEAVCATCGSHLGHVFDDGPETMADGSPATGQRYCINSLALDLEEKK